MTNKRNTIQRKVVHETLMRQKNHPTVEELHAEIQKDYPAISKTTVYRNLRILAQDGMVRQVMLLDGLERYEGQLAPHYHFKCRVCGEILDVEIPSLAYMEIFIKDRYGFLVESHDIVFHGICADCKLKLEGEECNE